jgi:hypothetical protein
MGAPPAVCWLLVALCGATALYCVARVCARGHRGADRVTDGAEALMGGGMALMALPGGMRALPPAAWVAVFGAGAGWAGLRALRARHAGAHQGYHAVGHLAMVYMALAMARGGMPGMGAGVPALTAALALGFAAYGVWAGTRVVAAPCGGGGVAATQVRHACRVVMSLAMFTELLMLT